jgi:hypothetical protein
MVCLISTEVAGINGCRSGGPAVVDGGEATSGDVQSNRWPGFGRGVILSTMVCLVGSETASIAGIGAAAVAVAGGGSRPFSGELSRCM